MSERTRWWIERWLECRAIYLSIYPLSICVSIYLSICPRIYLSIYHVSICLSTYLSNYLCVYLSVYLSICLSVFLSICLPISIYLSIYLSNVHVPTSTCLSLDPAFSLSICLSTYLPMYLSVYLSIYLSVDLSIYIHPSARLPIWPPSNLSNLSFSSIYLSIYLSIDLSIHPSIHLSFHLSIYLSVYLSIFLSIYLSESVYLSVFLSTCLKIYLSIYLTNLTYLSIYLNLSICPSVYLSVFLSTCQKIYLSFFLSIYLSICLSAYLSIFISFCLPVYLQAWKGSYSASCETSLQFATWKLKNKAFLRDFLNFRTSQHQIGRNSARLPHFVKLTSSKTKQFCETSFKNDKVECRADGIVPLRFAICPSDLSKVPRLPRNSDARSYEELHLSCKIILPKQTIWCFKMQPFSGNLLPDLLTYLTEMSLALRLPREMHLCRCSSNAPRLSLFLKMLENPHTCKSAASIAPATQNELWTSKSGQNIWCFYPFDFDNFRRLN